MTVARYGNGEGAVVPIVSIVFGGLLIALGVWGKVSTGTASFTPLIPAVVGGLLAVLGLVALKESLLKHAMHGAAVVGLLGFLGGIANIIRVLAKGGSLEGTPGLSTIAMTVLCAVFVALCVNSFIQARRRRKAREAAAPGA
jgi:hypothetical protein